MFGLRKDFWLRASNLKGWCAGRAVIFLAALQLPRMACAGPPFLTDDPEPTETHHWEIYAPLWEGDGTGKDFDGTVGAEINYGALKDVQITIGMSAAYHHDTTGWHTGAGDFGTSVKYRFYHNEAAGVQLAAFPGVSIPTGGRSETEHVTALLPIWAQKDFGNWSVFGGGGYAINPGKGRRDFWTGGVAITHQLTERLLVGVEADRQGPDEIEGQASTSLGLGVIYDLPGPFRLLASGGPTLDDGGGTGFHGFAALGLDF